MSLLDHRDEVEAPNIQVWNNAAFDNGESDVTNLSWSNPSSKSVLTDCSKENLCPLSMNTPASLKYSVSLKPLNAAVENSLKSKCCVSSKSYGIIKGKEERNIDEEIKETEREIEILSAKLKALRIEKAARTAVQKGGRFVPIKSIEPKVRIKSLDGVKMFDLKIGQNRGLSLGPPEILAGAGFQRMQSRRQSCLPKLLDINEEKTKSRRGTNMSISPKSRRPALIKAQALRQSATTIVSKRGVKKDGVLELIQPKKLFKDIDKPVTPIRTGRVVASRYNQTNKSSHVATENRQPSSSEHGQNKTPQSTVRKRWEIPNDILVLQREMELGTGRESG